MRTKKKIWTMIFTMALVAAMLTGCMGTEYGIVLNGDGTCAYTVKYLYEKSTYDTLVEGGADKGSVLSSGDFCQTTETIDGKTYYAFARSFSFGDVESMRLFLTDNTAYYNKMVEGSKKPGVYEASKETLSAPFGSVTLDASTFQASLTSDNPLVSSMNTSMQSAASGEAGGVSTNSDVGGISKSALGGYDSINEYLKSEGFITTISITMPAPITDSNGTVSGNTVTWDVSKLPDDNKLLAVTNGTPIASDTVAPTISGVKDKGIYKKRVVVVGTDDVSLPSLSLNGLRFNTNKLPIATSGTYTVVATDANNNTATVSFTVDTKKPKIKGIKSGKVSAKGVTLRFSDNMGVKSATVNGKSVNKKKVTIKKAGRYVVKVTDIAGNVTTARFRIK